MLGENWTEMLPHFRRKFFEMKSYETEVVVNGYCLYCVATQRVTTQKHSTEIRGLCSMKLSSEMLQNLPYFLDMKTLICSLFRFAFRVTLIFFYNWKWT